MGEPTAKITVDDIVAAAGAGALRAISSRGGGGDKEVSIERLVSAGFGVRFEIWAGGWPGPWGPNGFPGGLPGKAGGGGIGG